MNKEVIFDVLLNLKAGRQTPAPPIGTVLGPTGIDTNKFCEDFNNWSKNSKGTIETGIIVYDDLSYAILTKEQYMSYKRTEFSKIVSRSPLYGVYKEEENRRSHK